jgi:hypothetical protein
MKKTAFLDISPCSLVEVYGRFRGSKHPLKRLSTSVRLGGAISQKAVNNSLPLSAHEEPFAPVDVLRMKTDLSHLPK